MTDTTLTERARAVLADVLKDIESSRHYCTPRGVGVMPSKLLEWEKRIGEVARLLAEGTDR